MEAANDNQDKVLAAQYPLVSGSNKGIILEIRRERRVEMVMENLRYDDIMRWKAGHLFTEQFKGVYFSTVTAPSTKNKSISSPSLSKCVRLVSLLKNFASTRGSIVRAIPPPMNALLCLPLESASYGRKSRSAKNRLILLSARKNLPDKSQSKRSSRCLLRAEQSRGHANGYPGRRRSRETYSGGARR